MHVYIAPEPGSPVLGHFTELLCCHDRCKALLKHIAIKSCQVLIFMDG